ncbi:MAG: pyruvate kinase alpha/beta domain-containing protein [Candidatus ainarchaeum sp.]|nr:pyruvate kinase alpha/beta domain-containing protein [Candidatus ainarchaeum sp.]
MKERKIFYFEEPGEKNTSDALDSAYARLKEGGIRHIVVASHSGATALKAAEKFRNLAVNIVAVTVSASTKKETIEQWDKNVPKLEKLKVRMHRGTHCLSGIERAVKARWGTAGPVIVMGDTLRVLGEGTKVGVEISLMAADAGLIPNAEKVMAIAGTGLGADTCIVIKSAYSSQFFDLAIQEIVCKPYSEGVKHEPR